MTRCPFSLSRLWKVSDTGQVVYQAEKQACRAFPDSKADDTQPRSFLIIRRRSAWHAAPEPWDRPVLWYFAFVDLHFEFRQAPISLTIAGNAQRFFLDRLPKIKIIA